MFSPYFPTKESPLKTIRSFQHQAVWRLPVAPSAQGPVQRQVARGIGPEKLTEHLAKAQRAEGKFTIFTGLV